MKKLLQQVKRKYNHHLKIGKNTGLCYAIYKLRQDLQITEEDYDFLNEFMDRNTPDVLYYFSGRQLLAEDISDGFWWPIDDTKSRFEWLDKQIKVKEL